MSKVSEMPWWKCAAEIIDAYHKADYLKVTFLPLRVLAKLLPEVDAYLTRCLRRRCGPKLSKGESFLNHCDNLIPIAHSSLPDVTTGQCFYLR